MSLCRAKPEPRRAGGRVKDYLAVGILARLVEGVNAADVGVLLALVWLVVRLIDGLKGDVERATHRRCRVAAVCRIANAASSHP